MARSAYEDPIKVFRYTLAISGVVRAAFTEVLGLEAETEAAEYREGGSNESPQKSAGLTKYNDLTLKRGQIVGSSRGGDDDLLTWYQLVKQANQTQGNNPNYRKDITIKQYDATNTLAKTWIVRDSWPKRYKPFSDLNGTSNDNSIEELLLTHEGFDEL